LIVGGLDVGDVGFKVGTDIVQLRGALLTQSQPSFFKRLRLKPAVRLG
jgi:hypothetical protein